MPITICRNLTRNLPVPQINSACCWLASYQMMFKWKGRNNDEAVICQLLESAYSSEAARKGGLPSTKWFSAAEALGMRTSVSSGLTSIHDIVWEIETYGALMTFGKWSATAHVMCVFGADTDENKVYVVDPWWTGDAGNVGYEWRPFDEWAAGANQCKGIGGAITHW